MITYKIFTNGVAEVREPTINKCYTAYRDKDKCTCIYIGNDLFQDDMEGWYCAMQGFPFLIEHS